MHTLVIVRWERRNGANCNFFVGIAKALCVRKEMKLALCLVTPRRDCFFLFKQKDRIKLINHYKN